MQIRFTNGADTATWLVLPIPVTATNPLGGVNMQQRSGKIVTYQPVQKDIATAEAVLDKLYPQPPWIKTTAQPKPKNKGQNP